MKVVQTIFKCSDEAMAQHTYKVKNQNSLLIHAHISIHPSKKLLVALCQFQLEASEDQLRRRELIRVEFRKVFMGEFSI